MSVAAWVTVILAMLIVFFAAVGLLRVVLHLRTVDKTLAALTGGVEVIADKTSTVPTVLPSVNSNPKPVRDFADSI